MPDVNSLLREIDRKLRQSGQPEMDADTLRELAKQLAHPQVQQAFYGGQLTTDSFVQQVLAGMKENQRKAAAATEGGLVNDSSGQATQMIRNQLGIQQQSSSLPPAYGSRIYGEGPVLDERAKMMARALRFRKGNGVAGQVIARRGFPEPRVHNILMSEPF